MSACFERLLFLFGSALAITEYCMGEHWEIIAFVSLCFGIEAILRAGA